MKKTMGVNMGGGKVQTVSGANKGAQALINRHNRKKRGLGKAVGNTMAARNKMLQNI